MHSNIEFYRGIPVISVYDTPLSSRSNQLIKRFEDLTIATLALFIFSPIMIIVAIVVKFSSPGPVLFKQVRHGLSGKEILVYKFRSMTTQDNCGVIQQATRDDARTTKVGRFIRKTSLDELPQLFNVLKGEMSIVGPRPHARAHNNEYRKQIPSYMLRHIAKPGITGYAQVLGYRGATDTIEQMKLRLDADLYYISNWNLWFDFRILVLTVFVGFINKNAY
jgi:putative colanic acid biosynthesis UDP-glucose lipid carrier transferase